MTVTILAVHGNGGGGTRFERVAEHLPDESTRFEYFDLPGFNGTPIDPEATDVAAYADKVADVIESLRRPDEPVVVLGHGIGGSIALDLASRRPETMDGLILHAPVGADLDTRLFPRLMSTKPVREVLRRMVAARPLRPIWRKLFFPIGAPKEDTDTFFEGYRDCAAFGQMFEIIDVEWFEALAPVTELPVVLLWGEHDRVLKSGQTEGITAKTPNAEKVIEPGWDHFPMLEQPEEYARVISTLAADLVTNPSA
ncbi:MAG: alpha/beta hydrolase [Ilumatobacter sp.]|uniref:alpha/beta fold hydrolase n=1 Tax=Ilumatobacter sp. TaxID=1967498 RepID=UPI003C78F659